MKQKPLYVFAAIVHLIWMTEANVLHDLEKKILEGKEGQGCTIPNKWQEFRCDVDPRGQVIPEGTKCTVLRDNTYVFNYVCESGMTVAIQHTYKGTNAHHIQKRFLAAVLVVVGSVVGFLGSVAVGTIGITCAFTDCNPSSSEGKTSAPNEPPIIICPTVLDQIADKLQETIQVHWTEPTAADPEGKHVEISSSDDPSGSEFGNGNHAILYTATDDVGNKDTCEIRFHVTVIRCLESQYVENGIYKCDTKTNIYGTVCSVSCNEGYKLPANSDAVKLCDKNSSSSIWTPSTTVACQKKNCSVPQNPCNGKLLCSDPGYAYLSICHPTCNKGYDTDTTKYIICDVNGWSGQIDECQDVQRPEFVFCPQTVHKFADRGTREVTVQWPIPTASDNSHNDEVCGSGSLVNVKHISGFTSGSTFRTGNHEIIYSATDSSNNKANCSFTVIVEELTCQPLSLEDKYVLVSCEAGYTYGSSCSFSCFMSYKLEGDLEVTCERNSSDENAAYWNWTNNTKSYCEKLSCPELPAPVGGALSCSSAHGSPVCVMSCAKPNVVPLGTSIEYHCNDQQVWLQGIPPNCTDYIHPRMATLGGEVFYYYDGDCSNQSVQTSIKQNFIDVMVDLENSDKWNDDLCPAYCTLEGVTITCGPGNGKRRKRSSSNQIFTLTFTLMSTWQVNDILQVNDEIITKMGEHMISKVTEGAFDYPGVTTESMVVGISDYYCPEGQKATYSDDAGLCKGCPPGKFLHNGDCLECAKGYYQDKEYQINCTECPDGQLTEQVGSTSIYNCQDICQPGTFSKTGLVPCSSCLRGQFQQEAGSVTCLPCPDQMFTLSTGSASQSDCTLIDVLFTSGSGLLSLPTMENEIQNFTLSYIMKHGDSVEQGLQFKLGSFEMSSGKQIKMTVGSETRFFNYTTTDDIQTDWKQVAITWNRLERKSDIFINGQKRTTLTFTAFTDEEIELPISQPLVIKAKAAGLTLTGLVFNNSILSDTLINQIAENCSPNLSSVLLTMRNVFTTDSIDTELSLSKCDVINECKTNPCGNGNICINEQNGYSCQCLSGYSGANCDIPPDFCKVNGCKNSASCISNFDSYSCVCDSSFTGPICETEIIHGNWGSWLDWSECSQSCNGGTQSRVRYCDDPAPNLHGRDCPETNMSLQACNTDPCPVCPSHSIIYSYKNSFNCTSISDSTSCVVTCQDGFRFARDYQPLDQYGCGPQTGYMWNAIPPPCARSISPRSVSANVAVMHNDVDCSNEESVSATLKQNLNNLQCVENNTCTVSTSTSGCGRRRKRSTETSLQTNIRIISLQLEKPLNLEELYSNNIVSPGLLEMVVAYIDLTMSLNQLNTTDVLTIDDKGTVYSADLSSLKIATVITCPDGTVEQELMCDECPFGTYWSNRTCVMCLKGTYQDESGQVNCKNCPVGLTTHYIASRNESECSVADPVAESPVNESSENQTGVIVPIAVGAIIAFGVMVFLVFFVRKKHRESTRTKGKISRCASVVNTNMIHPTLEESNGEQIDPTPAEQNNFEMGYPWTMEHEMIGKMRFQSLPPIDNRQLITDKILPRKPMLSPIGHVSPDPTV